MKEDKQLEDMKWQIDVKLILTQNKVKELEARSPECTDGILAEKIKQLEQQLKNRMRIDLDKIRQDLEGMQKQFRVIREERNKY